MHPKLKASPSGAGTVGAVKPLVLHDVTNPAPRSGAQARLRVFPVPTLPASHARHHVAPGNQA